MRIQKYLIIKDTYKSLLTTRETHEIIEYYSNANNIEVIVSFYFSKFRVIILNACIQTAVYSMRVFRSSSAITCI